jgi:hypothetical protein
MWSGVRSMLGVDWNPQSFLDFFAIISSVSSKVRRVIWILFATKVGSFGTLGINLPLNNASLNNRLTMCSKLSYSCNSGGHSSKRRISQGRRSWNCSRSHSRRLMLLRRHQVAPCLNHFKTIDVPIRFSCRFCASVVPKLLHMGLVVIRKLISPAVPPEPCMMIWLY